MHLITIMGIEEIGVNGSLERSLKNMMELGIQWKRKGLL